jgi:4-hydroxybenzoate polyprenyltransferase
VKNLFVLAPLIFSKHLLDGAFALRGGAAFALFCLASGVVYLINDLVDVTRDRLHPVKCHRPIPSGTLSMNSARLAAALIGPGAIGGAYLLAPELAWVISAYIALNLFYSVVLKHLPYLDVLAIAAGFLLRVWGGALALGVPTSGWLLGCTALVATYLGLGKRTHELASLGERAYETRAVLERYRLPHLKVAMLLTAVATSAAYAAYTLAPSTRTAFGTNHLVITVPFVLFGLLRFYQLVVAADREGSPTDEMLRDARFLATLALCGIALLVAIYGLGS